MMTYSSKYFRFMRFNHQKNYVMFQSYTCNNTFVRLLKSTCYCTNQSTMTSNPVHGSFNQ